MSAQEAKFRRAWTAALRRQAPFLSYMSSMNREGVPDEHMIADGRAIWIELKAVDKWPKGAEANVLAHRFTGAQLHFLRQVDAAGGRGLGVIGFRDAGAWQCVALRVHHIQDDGRVSRREIERHRRLTVDDTFAARFLELISRS